MVVVGVNELAGEEEGVVDNSATAMKIDKEDPPIINRLGKKKQS